MALGRGWDCTKVPLGDVMTFDPRACDCMLDLSGVCFSTGLRPCTSPAGEPCRLQSPEQRDTAQDWLASSWMTVLGSSGWKSILGHHYDLCLFCCFPGVLAT